MSEFLLLWWVLPTSVLFSTIAISSGVSGALFFSPFMLVIGLAQSQRLSVVLNSTAYSQTRHASIRLSVTCRTPASTLYSEVSPPACVAPRTVAVLTSGDRAHSRFPGHALTPTGVMAIHCKQFHLPDL